MIEGIKVVFIDVDDTLLDFLQCAKNSLKDAEEAFSLSLPENTLDVFFEVNDELWRALERGELTFERLHEIRWIKIFERINVDFDGTLFESVFWKRLREIAVPMSGAREILEYLSQKYVVCLASNAPVGQQNKKMTDVGLIGYVDHVFVSGAIGYAKPKKEFFDGCFSNLEGVKKEEVLMIGDSLTADIGGARAYGLKTCWFNHRGEVDKEGIADYEIKSLLELKDLL